MILVDSSVWIDHLRRTNARLTMLLSEGRVAQHPFVTAELALGSLASRDRFVKMLTLLPSAPVTDSPELLEFIAKRELFGTGLGMVDAHILASAASAPGLRLWTLDKRLAAQAGRMNLAHSG